jgi:CheY-like chemotaxis protein
MPESQAAWEAFLFLKTCAFRGAKLSPCSRGQNKCRLHKPPQSAVAFSASRAKLFAMTEPLAVLLYVKLAPGSQLVNRLQGLHYRVRVLNDPGLLQEVAEKEKPMIVLADLAGDSDGVPAALARLRQVDATAHIPVIAFTDNPQARGIVPGSDDAAWAVVSDVAVLNHLPQLLDRVLTDF